MITLEEKLHSSDLSVELDEANLGSILTTIQTGQGLTNDVIRWHALYKERQQKKRQDKADRMRRRELKIKQQEIAQKKQRQEEQRKQLLARRANQQVVSA